MSKKEESLKKGKRKIWPFLIAFLSVVLLAAVIVFVVKFLHLKEEEKKREQKEAKLQQEMKLAEEAFEKGEYQEAIDCFLLALSYDEENVDAFYGLANAYQADGQTEKADKALSDGLFLTDAKKLERALKSLREEQERLEKEKRREEQIKKDELERQKELLRQAELEKKKGENEGNVLNIYCLGDEFRDYLIHHYPYFYGFGDEDNYVDNVQVKWHITPTYDTAESFEETLLQALSTQKDADPDERVDLIILEPHYMDQFINGDESYIMAMEELGISRSELENQFPYTLQQGSDQNGILRGVGWSSDPGVLIYQREIAKEVFGSDEKIVIDETLLDWKRFAEAADRLSEYGYKMTATVFDTYRAFSAGATTAWVDSEGKLSIDPARMDWVELSKQMVEKGQTTTNLYWSQEWSKGFYPDGRVFCYFGPYWFLSIMDDYIEGSVANLGGWNVAHGPAIFRWGGRYICAAVGTDNRQEICEIIRKLTMDSLIMEKYTIENHVFPNNREIAKKLAEDDSYCLESLGGTNPNELYASVSDELTVNLIRSSYDDVCDNYFQEAMVPYFEGEISLEEAIEAFYGKMVSIHPELSY